MGLGDDRMECFVRESPWEYAAVQDNLLARIPREVWSPRPTLIVEDVTLISLGPETVRLSTRRADVRTEVRDRAVVQPPVAMDEAVP